MFLFGFNLIGTIFKKRILWEFFQEGWRGGGGVAYLFVIDVSLYECVVT